MEPKSSIKNIHFGIKELAEDDRPREKLLLMGRQYLSNAELLAIIIGTGTPNCSAVELGQQVLQTANNNLNELGRMSIADFKKTKGIGEAKAVSLMAALEIGRRRKAEETKVRPKLTCSKDGYDQFSHILEDLPHEEFWVLFLSRNSTITGKKRISTGGISGTVVDAKIVFKAAVDALATGILLAHNHPSGNCYPSEQDIQLTKRLIECGKVLEIYIGDHIIVAGDKYFSFADSGLINR